MLTYYLPSILLSILKTFFIWSLQPPCKYGIRTIFQIKELKLKWLCKYLKRRGLPRRSIQRVQEHSRRQSCGSCSAVLCEITSNWRNRLFSAFWVVCNYVFYLLSFIGCYIRTITNSLVLPTTYSIFLRLLNIWKSWVTKRLIRPWTGDKVWGYMCVCAVFLKYTLIRYSKVMCHW